MPRVKIPGDVDNATLSIAGREVRLTNLRKPFWPELGITKGDLIQYYADVSPVLLPHIRDRAMVMKRYPHGAAGPFFFMKRAPEPRPAWIRTCAIDHGSKGIIDFPVIDDVPSLLWVINLGCIDLNQWYARCDDVDRPDYLHFDLDPGEGATFAQVREAAIVVRDALEDAAHEAAGEDERLQGAARLRADRARSGAEAGVDVRQGAGGGAGVAASGTDDVGVPRGEAAAAGACSWTTTRTRGAGRWPASIPSGRRRGRPCRRR